MGRLPGGTIPFVGAARIVPADEGMAEAVERLRIGQLVAFPTETVYGLGANARDADAVERIFAAKGRPATNPLIVHVTDTAGAKALASDWPAVADALAARFWPGPLTLVVNKSDAVPGIVTGGGSTVGLRVPAHPAALELLLRSGVPVAAPSANRSEEVSPTTARHVAESLGPWVDDLLILDGGPTMVGIESTVLDVTASPPPRILRPGTIGAAELREIIDVADDADTASGVARSPGQMLRHYAPRTPVFLVSSDKLQSAAGPDDAVLWLPSGGDPRDYATTLYAALRDLDRAGKRRILVEAPPEAPEWNAVNDRLRRAATGPGR